MALFVKTKLNYQLLFGHLVFNLIREHSMRTSGSCCNQSKHKDPEMRQSDAEIVQTHELFSN